MRAQAPLDLPLPFPRHQLEADKHWPTRGLRRTRLARNLGWRCSRRIPCILGVLRRSRASILARIDRPPRRASGPYADLSNTR